MKGESRVQKWENWVGTVNAVLGKVRMHVASELPLSGKIWEGNMRVEEGGDGNLGIFKRAPIHEEVGSLAVEEAARG